MEKDIVVNGKSFKIRELLAIEVDNLEFPRETDTEEVKKAKFNELAKKQIMCSANLSEEEVAKLTWKERNEIMGTINEINGFSVFQKPTN